MNAAKCFRVAVCALACLGMLLPCQTLLAVDATPPAGSENVRLPPTMTDVALSGDGMFSGRIVNPRGAGLAHLPVVIQQQQAVVAKTITDANGNFQVAGLRGGVYQLTADGSHASYRLWAPGTAPPAAGESLLVVSGGRIVAGQPNPIAIILSDPIVVFGALAGIIGVVVAIANHSQDRGPSS